MLVPPRGERALPVLSGVLLALVCPPAAFLLPPFVALAPLLVFIAERPPGPRGRWAATRAGLVVGAIYFGVQLYWLAVALLYYSWLAIPAYLLTVLVLTGLAGTFGWAVHMTRERIGLPLPIGAAVFWTALEWVQGHLGDLAFPWLGLGTGLSPYPRLAGAAELVGARGLTFWLAAVSGALAVALVRYRDRQPVRAVAIGTAVLVAVPAAFGIWRAQTLELRPVARVAVVQPNIPEDLKLDRRIAVDTSLAALLRLSERIPVGGVDLVAWPEVAIPTDLAGSPSLMAVVERVSARVGAPVLVGAYGVDARDPGGQVAFNSAFLIEAATVRGRRYDKQRLVPFVERVPFLDPGLLDRRLAGRPPFGGLGRGREAPVFTARNGARFGVLICYESIFAHLARRYRAAGAELLVNVTNDAWYGREPWYARTTALWQHPAHMVMRAIETRTGVARAANTGISMFVDPVGRTYGRTPLFQADTRLRTVFTTDVSTLFVRWGDWLATGSAVAALVLVLAAAGWDRTRRGRRDAS